MKRRIKLWMVERVYEIDLADGQKYYVPIRGVAKAKTRRQARQKANYACQYAAEQFDDPGRPSGNAQVLYAMGFASDILCKQ